MRSLLDGNGGDTAPGDDGSLTVRGIGREAVGEIAARHGIVLHELADQTASLEEVFMELTNSELEYSGSTGTEGERP